LKSMKKSIILVIPYFSNKEQIAWLTNSVIIEEMIDEQIFA